MVSTGSSHIANLVRTALMLSGGSSDPILRMKWRFLSALIPGSDINSGMLCEVERGGHGRTRLDRSEERGVEARFRPPSDAPVPRICDHLRWRVAGLSRMGTTAAGRPDHKRWRETGGGAHRQEPAASVGRVAAAVGVWPARRLRGCERRRAAVPRPGDALGGRRQQHRWAGLLQPTRRAALETEWLVRPENLAALARICRGRWIGTVQQRRSAENGVVLDMDSTRAPITANRRRRLQRPFRLHLLPPARFRVQPARRSGRPALWSDVVHSADRLAEECWEPVVARYRGTVEAAFYFRRRRLSPTGDLRVPRSRGATATRPVADHPGSCKARSGYLLKPPLGEAARVRRFTQASSTRRRAWNKPAGSWRRSVASGREVSPRVGIIVTNLARPAEASSPSATTGARMSSTSQRRQGRDRSGRGCRAAPSKPTRGFAFQLHALAYNLGNSCGRWRCPRRRSRGR